MTRSALAFLLVLCAATAYAGPNYSITAEPYIAGGLFTTPLIPKEDEDITITIRATCAGGASQSLSANVTIINDKGAPIHEEEIALQASVPVEGEETPKDAPPTAEGTVVWRSAKNGLFRVKAALDPKNTIAEDDESDNDATLVLPVTVAGPGRDLHFPWYREVQTTRWCTSITSSQKCRRLLERGVKPLNWEFGGMSWCYYDKERAKNEPEAVLQEFRELFYGKFATDADVYGFGIDEVGGYPGSWKLRASVASLESLVKAKAENPDRYFVVWNAGGLRPEVAALCRDGADVLLLETYLWRALPGELGFQDIYAALDSRIQPHIRATDLFQPIYGNHCYTLFGLDTSERPDRIELGELEQVIRYIRRKFPEMRGVGWYTGGYGEYGLVRTEETDHHHEAVQRKADTLCFEYWIKPCLTLMQESLWLSENDDGSLDLVLAVSNIGGIDASSVEVEFLADGASIGKRRIDCVPAGTGRHDSTVQVRQPCPAGCGPRHFEAQIVGVSNATVLDPAIELTRFIN